jgi:hypothetical protein
MTVPGLSKESIKALPVIDASIIYGIGLHFYSLRGEFLSAGLDERRKTLSDTIIGEKRSSLLCRTSTGGLAPPCPGADADAFIVRACVRAA